MTDMPTPIVDVDWLAQHLGEPELLIFDASNSKQRWQRFIPGALIFDLEVEMADTSGELDHVMLPMDVFEQKLRDLGVDDDSRIVVYDDEGIYASPRAWWMLRAAGLHWVAVLDGGLPAWIAAGNETVAEPGVAGTGSVTLRPEPTAFVDADAVAIALNDPRQVVVDARSADRFEGTGAEKWANTRLGHMPGARNLPFTQILDQGHLRPLHQLEELFRPLVGEAERITFSCGSGVTACILALGADAAGISPLAVYDGSWQEWGADPKRPVATGPDVG